MTLLNTKAEGDILKPDLKSMTFVNVLTILYCTRCSPLLTQQEKHIWFGLTGLLFPGLFGFGLAPKMSWLQVTSPTGHWSDIYVVCNDQVNIITIDVSGDSVRQSQHALTLNPNPIPNPKP